MAHVYVRVPFNYTTVVIMQISAASSIIRGRVAAACRRTAPSRATGIIIIIREAVDFDERHPERGVYETGAVFRNRFPARPRSIVSFSQYRENCMRHASDHYESINGAGTTEQRRRRTTEQRLICPWMDRGAGF